MEIVSIKGDEVLLLFHPADDLAGIGDQYKILELPNKTEGLIIQIISNDSLEYVGIQQELIQKVLEERFAKFERINRELGMGEMRSLKLATAKIRKRISQSRWEAWGGWIPTRNVVIEPISATELTQNILEVGNNPIELCSFQNTPISFDGSRLNMVNVVTGVKGSGKSHTAKLLVLWLSYYGVPVIVFDINGEYINLPNVQVLRWGDNFRPSLADVGYEILRNTIQAVYPLPETSDNVFSQRLPVVWASRKAFCRKSNRPFDIDVAYLKQQTWNKNDLVQEAITGRLEVIEGMDLFAVVGKPSEENFRQKYNLAAGVDGKEGHPIIFDMRDLEASRQQALVKAMNSIVKEICREEDDPETGKGRFPFLFYEEAHFYIREDVIIDIITRGRHIGMGTFFVTNTPQELPRTVFRQLDNLFLLGLTHNDDIRNVSQSSFTDEATVRSFATRMPKYHGLIMGNATSRYPLVVKINDLPDGASKSGRTRSTWERFEQ